MNIEEVMKDEAFLAQVKSAESMEDVAKLFNAKGIDVTAAELEAEMNNQSDELDETALDDVAGGVNIGLVRTGISNVVWGFVTVDRARVAKGAYQIAVGLRR